MRVLSSAGGPSAWRGLSTHHRGGLIIIVPSVLVLGDRGHGARGTPTPGIARVWSFLYGTNYNRHRIMYFLVLRRRAAAGGASEKL